MQRVEDSHQASVGVRDWDGLARLESVMLLSGVEAKSG